MEHGLTKSVEPAGLANAEENTRMCDYSLEHLASRDAQVGDKLVSTRFQESISRGFAAVGEPNVAVCLRPGTEIAFEDDVVFDNVLGAGRQSIPSRVARFRQVDKDTPHLHHDALEFPDGRTVLVTRLIEGQRATVLQLPAMPHAERETVRETRPQRERIG
jgi:hypothetical protein